MQTISTIATNTGNMLLKISLPVLRKVVKLNTKRRIATAVFPASKQKCTADLNKALRISRKKTNTSMTARRRHEKVRPTIESPLSIVVPVE